MLRKPTDMPAHARTRQLTRQQLQLDRFRISVRSGPDSGAACLSGGVELTIGTGGSGGRFVR